MNEPISPPPEPRIVSLCGCSNWFYYPAAASTPDQVRRVAAWALMDDGSVTGLLMNGGRRGELPKLELPRSDEDGVFRHLADLSPTLRPR